MDKELGKQVAVARKHLQEHIDMLTEYGHEPGRHRAQSLLDTINAMHGELARRQAATGQSCDGETPCREMGHEIWETMAKLGEERDRAMGAVLLLGHQGIITTSRAAELLGLSLEKIRSEYAKLAAEVDTR